jgi:hypothetical protein
MHYHFMLDHLESAHAEKLRSIESTMTDGRTRTAVFELKILTVFMDRDPAKAQSYIAEKLGAFHMKALEALLTTLGMELLDLYKAVHGVFVTMKPRPSL